MAKKRRIFTKKLRDKFIQDGRGSGENEFYRPWITIHDFASIGRCHRIPNWKYPRLHHLMSDLEERVFYVLSWSEKVIDIREQFPLLEHEETIEIANDLKIKHPTDPKSRFPTVLTTDFLLRINGGDLGDEYIARTVKPAEQINNPRICEKLEIERRFWTNRGIDWGIITENDFPRTLFYNVKLVYHYFQIRSLRPLSITIINSAAEKLTELATKTDLALRDITTRVDEQFEFVDGMSMNIACCLIARRLWHIDMHTKIDMSKPITWLDDSAKTARSIEIVDGEVN